MQKSYELLNIKITDSNKKEIRRVLEKMFEGTTTAHIITLNLDHLRIASENMVYNQICKNANLVLIDGIGIALLLRKKYGRNFSRITGNDILLYLFSIASKNQSRITIIGGNQIYKDKLFDRIVRNYPSLNNNLQVLTPKLNFDLDESLNSAVVEEVISFNPEILIVALGCPRQEIWIYKHKKKIGAKLNIGVGAAIDYYSGAQKRSPNILQKIGLEWVWRLMLNPKRLFTRYIIKDIPFYFKIRKH